jgi:hypothetical protein
MRMDYRTVFSSLLHDHRDDTEILPILV